MIGWMLGTAMVASGTGFILGYRWRNEEIRKLHARLRDWRQHAARERADAAKVVSLLR